MKLPRDLCGAELVKVLCRDFGYRKINQEGSHIICRPMFRAHTAFPFLITARCAQKL